MINFCDCIYEIKNCKLEKIKDNKAADQKEKAKEEKKKKINLFIKRYEMLRHKEYRLNRILVVITAIIIAIASLSLEFGKSFSDSQRDFINSISDRRMLAINDTLGINAATDYSDALTITGKK